MSTHHCPTHAGSPAQAKKHLRPKLLATAAAAGVAIKVVHFGQPLAEQGPFDVLLHKIRQTGGRTVLHGCSGGTSRRVGAWGSWGTPRPVGAGPVQLRGWVAVSPHRRPAVSRYTRTEALLCSRQCLLRCRLSASEWHHGTPLYVTSFKMSGCALDSASAVCGSQAVGSLLL